MLQLHACYCNVLPKLLERTEGQTIIKKKNSLYYVYNIGSELKGKFKQFPGLNHFGCIRTYYIYTNTHRHTYIEREQMSLSVMSLTLCCTNYMESYRQLHTLTLCNSSLGCLQHMIMPHYGHHISFVCWDCYICERKCVYVGENSSVSATLHTVFVCLLGT